MEKIKYNMRQPGSVLETELQRFCDEIKPILGDNPTIVELGSYMGESSAIFAKNFPNATIYCIDSWEGNFDDGDSCSSANYTEVEQQFDLRLSLNNNIKKIKGLSTDFKIECDMVYIDACHKYECVIKDIEHWSPLTSKIISGHDYYLSETFRMRMPHIAGVKIAVDEKLGAPDKIYDDGSWFKIKRS